MSQKEKTVQPSADEAAQTEPFQKTKDIAADQVKAAVTQDTIDSPSLQNAGKTEGEMENEKEASLDAANESLANAKKSATGQETLTDSGAKKKS